jgi:hypothetical protein
MSYRAQHRAPVGTTAGRRNLRRLVGGTVAAATFTLASGVAYADNIYNTLDTTIDTAAEAMALTVGGADGTTTLKVDPQGGDGKGGCNLTGATTLVVALASSNAAVATVSPSSVTFTSCGDVKNVTVTPVAAGTANITASQTSNNTGGTFDFAPARFTVNVGPALPPPPPVDTTPPSAPTIDLVAASDTGSSSTDNLTNDTTPTLSGDAEAGSTVEVFDGGASLGTTTATAGGLWNFTPTSALGDGTHSFTAKAKDAAGNISVASSTLSVTIDANIGVPTINLVTASDTGASSTDNVTSDSTPALDGTAKAGSSVDVFDGTNHLISTTASSSGAWSVTTGTLADGVHNLTAQATDAAGNISQASLTLTVTTDTAAPAAPSIDLDAASDSGSSNTDDLTKDATPTLTGVAENGTKVEVFEGGTSLGTVNANGTTGAWSLTTAALADGAHTFTAKATDTAGNTSGASAGLTVTVDTATTRPELNLVDSSDTGSSDTDNVTSDDTPTLDGTAEAGSTVNVYDGDTLLETVTAGNDGVYTTTVSSALADGVHNLVAKATDTAGNESTDSLTLTVTTDTAAPAAPSIDLDAASDTGVSPTDNLTNDATPTLSGSAENGSTVKVYEGSALVGTTTADATGWSLTTAALADGAHTFTAKATDTAGNTSVGSGGLTVTVDGTTAQPLLNLVDASDTGTSDSDDITFDTTPTLDGTAESDATVEVYEGSELLATGTADADGKWSTTLSRALSDGVHNLVAKATDTAGNVSTDSLTLTIKADTAGPTVTPGDVINTTWRNSALAQTFSAGDTGSGLTDSTDASFTLTASAESTKTGSTVTPTVVSKTVTDVAGNTTTRTLSALIDLTNPGNVSFVSGPAEGTRYYSGGTANPLPPAPTCSASDGLSGLKSCVVTGYSTAEGTHTMTATATDNAGNTASATRTYTVKNLSRTGFYAPVDMGSTVWNTIKGGNTVPLKFEVFDGTQEIRSTSTIQANFTVNKVSCTGGAEDAIETFATTGQTEFRYDTTGDQFIQNWKTPTGSGCYRVTMTTIDGQSISAQFITKK